MSTPSPGGSGIWAPSGLKLIQASHLNEELLIVHNIDTAAARRQEKDDFDYAFDFSEVYRPMDNGYGYTREIPLGAETTTSEPTRARSRR
jgi:hypothetical protein